MSSPHRYSCDGRAFARASRLISQGQNMHWKFVRDLCSALASIIFREDTLGDERPDGRQSGSRVALRVRKDGRTEQVRVDESSNQRSIVIAILAALAILTALFTHRFVSLKLASFQPAAAAAVA